MRQPVEQTDAVERERTNHLTVGFWRPQAKGPLVNVVHQQKGEMIPQSAEAGHLLLNLVCGP